MDALYLLSTTGHFPLIAKLFHMIGPDLPTYWKIAEGRACRFTGNLVEIEKTLMSKRKKKGAKPYLGFRNQMKKS